MERVVWVCARCVQQARAVVVVIVVQVQRIHRIPDAQTTMLFPYTNTLRGSFLTVEVDCRRRRSLTALASEEKRGSRGSDFA
jgi:hypothetical protein